MAEKTHDYVVIVAGGKGLRMGSDTPKQFLCVGGKPILMRTIERFAAYSKELRVILVLPEHQTNIGTSCAANMPSACLTPSWPEVRRASTR